MQYFFGSLVSNIARSFKGKHIWWHIVAFLLTAIIVLSGVDWFYFVHTRSIVIQSLSFPAVTLGGILPLLVPLVILGWSIVKRNKKYNLFAWGMGQAVLIGYLISTFYKALTGRIPPQRIGSVDISHGFHFGILKEGIFWGWPSSHTTIAFAMALFLISYFPKENKSKWLALVYAFYIGLGVSTTIHWFSEFVAGALIGSVIGMTVGREFKKLYTK